MPDLTVSSDIDTFMGSANKAAARTNLDLGNVDNTSDANKPVSTATQTALDLKADDADLTTETTARIAADNRRAFAGGVAFDGVAGQLPTSVILGEDGSGFVARFRLNSAQIFSQLFTIGGQANFTYGFWDTTSTFQVRRLSSTTLNGTWVPVVGRDYIFSARRSGADLIINVDGDDVDTISGAFTGTATGALTLASRNGSHFMECVLSDVAAFNFEITEAQLAAIGQDGIKAWLAENPEYKWAAPDLITNGDFSDFTGTADDQTTDTFTGWTVDLNGGTGYVDAITDSAPSGFTTAIEMLRQPSELNPLLIQSIDVSGKKGLLNLSFWSRNSGGGAPRYILGTTSGGTEIQVATSLSGSTDWSKKSISLDVSTYSTIFLTLTTSATPGTAQFAGVTSEGALAALPMDDGAGRELRELSGRYPALLSETGFEHLIPKEQGRIERTAQDLSASGLLFSGSDMIPAGKTITDLIVDGKSVAIADIFQDLDARALYVTNTAGVLTFSRTANISPGTTFGTVTPTDDADVDYTIIYK